MKIKSSKLLNLGAATFIIMASSTIEGSCFPSKVESYERQEFIADFKKFSIGDTIPKKYQTSEYIIKQWKIRNLPPPKIGTYWTYIGGHYILITNRGGKIYKIYSNDIRYHH